MMKRLSTRLAGTLSRSYGKGSNAATITQTDGNSYKYQQLQTNEFTRVIVLEPAREAQQELRCKIKHFSSTAKEEDDSFLPSSLEYEAVSYTWGAPTFPKILICQDNSILHITENLDAALRRFRLEDRNRYLWVDAVCINQNDLDERARQVSVMGDIYARASEVLVWLGEESSAESDGWIAIGLGVTLHEVYYSASPAWRRVHWKARLKEIMETLLRQIIDDSRWRRDGFVGGTRFFSEEEIREREEELADKERLWRPVRMFFSRPWFTRRWILQEVMNARHSTFYCGEAKIDGEAFVQVASWLRDPQVRAVGLDDVILESIMQMQSMMWGFNQHVKGHDPNNILDILETFQANECSDDRDRIYAVLGLLRQSPENLRFEFAVDYRSSPEVIFTRFATQILREGKSLDLLAFAGAFRRGSENVQRLELPSWVPDWRLRTKSRPFIESGKPLLQTGNSESLLIDEESGILRLQGLEWDMITKVATSIGIQSSPSSDQGSIDWMSSGREMQSLTRYSALDSETYSSHLSETLTARGIHDAYGQSSTLDFVFESMLGPLRDWFGGGGNNLAFGSIPSVVTHHEDGSVSETFQLRDIQGTENRRSSDDLIQTTMTGRSLFVTKKGYIGIGPDNVQDGDVIMIFFNANVPFILRPSPSSRFVILGDSYVHDIAGNKEMLSAAAEDWRDIQIE